MIILVLKRVLWPPVVGTIGTLQAIEAIKLLTGYGETLHGKVLIFDAMLDYNF